MLKTKIFVIILIALFATFAFAQSQPAFPPHTFFGDVLVNGEPAPDGTIVSAQVDGSTVASTTTVGGVYGKPPAADFRVRSDDGSFTGRIVRFFVNGVDSGSTAIFSNGQSTEVDLSVTITQPPGGGTTGGGAGGGGGGAGGGGGGALPQQTTGTPTTDGTTTSGACTERWLCTDWSECVDGLERRTCEDVNRCGTEENKPIESRPCSTVTPAEGTTGTTQQAPLVNFGFITAFITANPTGSAVLGVAILVLAYAGWRMWKRKNKSSSSYA